jgi:FdhD protein
MESNQPLSGREDLLKTFINRQVTHLNRMSGKTVSLNIVNEEPLSIFIQGKPYSVVLRTPGNEIAQVAGFCLAEGIIETLDDFTSIEFSDKNDTNKVMVSLKPSRLNKTKRMIEKRGFVSQTSSGIFGKELASDIVQNIPVQADDFKIDINSALGCLENLGDHQPLRSKTFATHGAAVCSLEFEVLSSAEDVGRHNGVDKAIGRLFLDNNLDKAAVLLLSSRTSYDLIQKAARAKISIILSISRPTLLAVDLASKLNLTLACLAKEGGLYVFSGEHRFEK